MKGTYDIIFLEVLLAAILEKGREGADSGTYNTTMGLETICSVL